RTGLVRAVVVVLALGPALAEAGRPRLVRRYQPARHEAPLLRTYAGARDAGLALLARFPPATHHIVGVGRSPAPVIAVLRALSSRQAPSAGDHTVVASTLPASGLKAPVPVDQYPAYFRHF